MKLPISHALDWPARVPDAQPSLDFSSASSWDFMPVDNQAFPAIRLAREVALAGGTYPAVYNAANEEAAAAFLAGRIRFPHIVDTVEEIVQNASDFAGEPHSVDEILAHEKEARRRANLFVDKLAQK